MCQNCSDQYEAFRDKFITDMRKGEEFMEKTYGAGKISNPAYESLVTLITADGGITLSSEEREKIVEYVTQLLYNCVVLKAHLDQLEGAFLKAMVPTDPSQIN